MRTPLAAFVLTGVVLAQGPSPTDFDNQLGKLTPKATKEERLAVAKWVRNHYDSKHAPKAIPALEAIIQKDPEAAVRREAVAALVLIVNRHDVPCPVGLCVALRDAVDEVRWEASTLSKPYQRKLAEGALEALIAATTDERSGVRSNSLLHLGDAAGKNPKALAAIEKAKSDNTFEVRHTAYLAHYRATKDLSALLTYIILVHEEPGTVLRPVPSDPEEAKREQSMRNLFSLGGSIRVIEWGKERPEDLANALLKLLDHKSPSMRRGAARLIGASARQVKLEKIDPLAGFKSDHKKPKEKLEPPMPSKALSYLLKGKALSRLRYVSTMDADESVRAAALLALERISELPEPLNVRPREVKP